MCTATSSTVYKDSYFTLLYLEKYPPLSCDSHYLCYLSLSETLIKTLSVLSVPYQDPYQDPTITSSHPYPLLISCFQYNGVAEKANGIISNRATSLLHESKLPPTFWARAVAAVSYTHNRMPTSALPNSVPHTAFYGSKPDVSLLRVFGST